MDQTKLEEQYDKIYRYCYYRLQQREIAEDITQETFLRFYRKDTYRFAEEPLKVLYTIARNLCVDEYRRSSDRTWADCDCDIAEDMANAPSPEDEILRDYMLRNAMNQLDETARDIVFMRLVNEEQFAVIAKSLGMSRFAVYRKYEGALKILRKELE